MNIIYSHRLDNENPGDLYSSPHHYFLKEHTKEVVDVFKGSNVNIKNKNDCYITGGGDILVSEKWTNCNKPIKDKANCKLNIVWGAGLTFIKQSVLDYINEFDLIGTRTYQKTYPNSKYTFVPCASVMHKALDNNYTVDKNVSIISHFKRKINNIDCSADVHIRNKPQSIEEVIKTIGTSKIIITNSYHTAYWSMLLNKKTIVMIEKENCKLSTFKHKPIYFYKDKFEKSLLTLDHNYKNVKEEYRDTNLDFLKRIENEIKSRNII